MIILKITVITSHNNVKLGDLLRCYKKVTFATKYFIFLYSVTIFINEQVTYSLVRIVNVKRFSILTARRIKLEVGHGILYCLETENRISTFLSINEAESGKHYNSKFE